MTASSAVSEYALTEPPAPTPTLATATTALNLFIQMEWIINLIAVAYIEEDYKIDTGVENDLSDK